MAKVNRWLIYGGVLAIGAAAFYMTEPSDKPAANKSSRRAAGVTRSTDKRLADFTDEDKDAVFSHLNVPVQNVFKPGIPRSAGKGIKGASAEQVNQVPPFMVGGDTNWFYTGTAYINSVPTVLLENTQTGQGDYYKVGEGFANLKVTSITPNSVVVASADGAATKTLKLIENRPIVDEPGGSYASNAPLNPLSGPISLNNNANSTAPSNQSRRPNNQDANNAPGQGGPDGPQIGGPQN